MASTAVADARSLVLGTDQHFTEAINQKMRVPDRLRVGVAPQEEELEKAEDTALIYRMHVPDRLSLADASHLNARPLFSTSSKYSAPSCLGPGWDILSVSFDREESLRDSPQSTLRRSFSDQTFGRSPAVTPGVTKQSLQAPSIVGCSPQSVDPSRPPSLPRSLLTPQNVLQTAKDLGRMASQRILLTITQKCASRFSYPQGSPVTPAEAPSHTDHSPRGATQDWLPEDYGGGSIELLVLRRQVIKMNRRLMALEKQNRERRQSEMLLFSLLLSACLLNGWLWLRR